jgi:hypothetical protein
VPAQYPTEEKAAGDVTGAVDLADAAYVDGEYVDATYGDEAGKDEAAEAAEAAEGAEDAAWANLCNSSSLYSNCSSPPGACTYVCMCACKRTYFIENRFYREHTALRLLVHARTYVCM